MHDDCMHNRRRTAGNPNRRNCVLARLLLKFNVSARNRGELPAFLIRLAVVKPPFPNPLGHR